jgi:peptide/nickel transport system substrate-binding protein
MFRKSILYIVNAVAILSLLAACAPTATPSEAPEVVPPTPVPEVEAPEPTAVELPEVPDVLGAFPRRETFVAAQLTGRVGEPDNFNEWVGWKWRDRGMQQLMNEPLWSIDFASGEIIPGLAAGDPVYNEDFTEVTIPLREGVTWSDGEPFTSADVVFTVETLIAHEGFNAHSFFADNVESVTAPDDYTVVFVLKQANSRFHTTFLDRWGCTWIMPMHIFEDVDDPVVFPFNPPVGTGPYQLHSYDPAGYWTVWERREDWQNSPTGILYGMPVPRYVVFQAFANEATKILAQLTHELDVADLSADGLRAALLQGEANRAYQLAFPWVVNNDPAMTGFTFNTARAPFDNPDVRWALLLAIDIAEYEGQAVDGTATLSPVHIPSLGPYPADYIEPMQDWLESFTLDLGNGETFQPYDPEAPARLAQYARERGYDVSDDPAYIAQTFGLGWYRYAPEVAEQLLTNNGFSKNADGEWLLPDGSPWRIEVLSRSDMSHLEYRNAAAAVQQWRDFGIDAVHVPTDNLSALTFVGEFDVAGNWPAQEPWGAGADLYRVLDFYNSAYVLPLGETTQGHVSRWSSPEMDDVIQRLRETDPTNTEEVVAIGIEGLQILVEEMPGVPTFGYIGFVSWDQTYWANWPGAENPYTQPYTHWGPFKYMTPFLEPTGN